MSQPFRNVYSLDFGQRRALLLPTECLLDLDPWNHLKALEIAEQHIIWIESYKLIIDYIRRLPDGCIIIVEYAHLGVPASKGKKMSLAQALETEEILAIRQLCIEKNIDLRLFPHKMAWKARRHAGFDGIKGEKIDAISIWKWCQDFPATWEACKRPAKTLEPSNAVLEGWALKDKLNEIHNTNRATIRYKLKADGSIKRDKHGKALTIPWYENDELQAWQFVTKHMYRIRAELPEKYWKCFGFDVLYGNNRPGQWVKGEWNSNNLMRLIPSVLYHCFIDLEGELIYRPQILPDGTIDLNPINGQLCGKKFLKQHIFCEKPYSDRGGVTKSNIYYWGLQKGWLEGTMSTITGQPRKKKKGEEDFDRILPCDLSPEDKTLKFNPARQLYINGVNAMCSIIKRIIMEEHGLELPPEWQQMEISGSSSCYALV